MALLVCPNCGARGVGKVGAGQFYCWECCVEFRPGRKGWQVYQVQDDGSLLAIEPRGLPADGRLTLEA
ncbi:MAG: hypothetical protein HPY55_08370 [Firmicutes bacterium]|nr:hypothetical protein [Bacillota bacterium]